MAELGHLDWQEAEGELGYLAWHADAERRAKRGERQLYCGECKDSGGRIWVWPDQCNHQGRLAYKEFRAMVREAKKHADTFDSDQKRYRRARRVSDGAID